MAAEEAPTSADMGRAIRKNFFQRMGWDGPSPPGTAGNRGDVELSGGGVSRESGSVGSCSVVRAETLICGAPQEGQKVVCSSIWIPQR
jgi:hypothetical protein